MQGTTQQEHAAGTRSRNTKQEDTPTEHTQGAHAGRPHERNTRTEHTAKDPSKEGNTEGNTPKEHAKEAPRKVVSTPCNFRIFPNVLAATM